MNVLKNTLIFLSKKILKPQKLEIKKELLPLIRGFIRRLHPGKITGPARLPVLSKFLKMAI